MHRYISGFDYLRASFAILVVIWHADSISFMGKTDSYLQNSVNIFYYNICLLAVPIFFSISLFLFYRKQLTSPNCFPKERFTSLIRLYGVWMFVGIAFNLLLSQGNYLLSLLHAKNFLRTVVQGSRPELFFLFSLILVSYLCFFNGKYLLGKKNSFYLQLIFMLISLLVMIFVSFYTLKTHEVEFSAYWNPVCFTPYIFSASLLAIIDNNTESGLAGYLYRKRFPLIFSLLSVFLLLSWLEWQIFNVPSSFGNYLLPPYARASLVIGSLLICYCAILYQGKPSNLVRELSQESLGIYLIHNYVLFLISMLQTLQFFQLPLKIIFNPIAKAIFVVSISMLVSKILKHYEIGKIMLNSRSK